MFVIDLDDLVRVHDDGDEERQHKVDEETNEGVKVDSAVDPNWWALMKVEVVEGGVHVVSIDERKETFGGGHETGELEMVRTKN